MGGPARDGSKMKKFAIRQIDYEEAACFCAKTHRHLPIAPPKMQCRVNYGVFWKDTLRAIAIVGTPVSPHLQTHYLEVRRLASDGIYGACSALYMQSDKYAESVGKFLVTYTFANESGASLIASGASIVKTCKRGKDTRAGRKNITSNIDKVRWEWPETLTHV